MKHLTLFLTMSSTAMAQVPSALQWQALGGGTNGFVEVLLPLDNGHLLVGGQFTSAGGVPIHKVAEWDGTAYTSFGAGLPMTAVNLCALQYEGEIWIGGGFGGIGYDSKEVARWNGAYWTFMDVFDGVFTSVRDLAVHDGDLYASGDDNSEVGGFVVATHHVVKKWNGASWEHVGSAFNEGVQALQSFNGSLIAGGAFTALDSSGAALSHVALFDTIANEWTQLADGLDAHVRALHVWDAMLYAGGELFDTTVTYGLARFGEGGANWDHLIPGLASYMQAGPDAAYVHQIAHTDDHLLLCGELDFLSTPNTGSGAGTWDGSIDGMSAIATPDAGIEAVAWWNGALVIGGGFTQLGTDSIPHIATVQDVALVVTDPIGVGHTNISPNPASQELTVTLDHSPAPNASLWVVDVNGRTVMSPRSITTTSTGITLGSLASGIYVLKVQESELLTTLRFVKE